MPFSFDLDGTLADTAPDMACALNRVLRAQGRPAMPFARIRPLVSQGGRALLELGFEIPPDHPPLVTSPATISRRLRRERGQ